MLPISMDYARESGGGGAAAAGTVLIPTRFVWPYGGRSVYISGSFTGWTDHFQMTPVEGCPTVFQTVCSLPPGVYQYKYIVDGEWRHDEYQPFVSGSYGMVNTILLSRDSNSVPTILSPQTPAGSGMDVDNDAFQHLVRVSEGTMDEALPRISEADLQVSRHRISEFLSTHAACKLLPESGKFIALDVDLPVKQAFHVLHEQLGNHGSNLTEEELEAHTISAWKEAKLYLNRKVNEHDNDFASPLVQAGPHENLKEVSLQILEHGVSTVPIIYSASEDGSYPQLLHLATLSEILKCICRYFRNSSGLLPILQLPICASPLGTWVPKIGESNRRLLAMLRLNASLGAALNLLVQAQVSSVPVVDGSDSLVDVYCRSDITCLAKDKIYTHINPQEITIQQALQLGQQPHSPFGITSQRCHVCLRSDPLHNVMERLSKPGVRRLFVVEAGSKRLEGVISLSDIFRFLVGY